MGGRVMEILLSLHEGVVKNKYFPLSIIEKMESLGTVRQNMLDRPWTEKELAREIENADICVTHWGSPRITDKVVENANKLKLVAHCAGSVFNIVCPEVYEKGIKVVSANKVMARAVAEGTLGYMLAALLKIKKYSRITKEGGWKTGPRDYGDMKILRKSKVLLVGFGDIGRYLYDLLVPFETDVGVYDPFLKDEVVKAYPDIHFIKDLDNAVPEADIVSLHASRNPTSTRLFGKDRIDLIKNDALFVNTARGSLVDEQYLTQTLKTGRIQAALDVYETEPLPVYSELRDMENVICMPHVAGSGVVLEYAEEMVREIGNFLGHRPLEYEITAEKAGMMTR
jgi:phosphoglycerate dehydrogenase-like enzyme